MFWFINQQDSLTNMFIWIFVKNEIKPIYYIMCHDECVFLHSTGSG